MIQGSKTMLERTSQSESHPTAKRFVVSAVVACLVSASYGVTTSQPASQEVSAPKPEGVRSWTELPGGINWGFARGWKAWSVQPGQPIKIRVHIANPKTVAHDVPVFYRDANQADPALLSGVTLMMRWAPFNISRPDRDYPDTDDYRPLKAIRTRSFPPGTVARSLKPGESYEAFTLNLRDWFKIDKPGHYTFGFDFDTRKMGLTGKGPWVRRRSGFILGTPPPVPKAEELNKSIPPLGGKGEVERIAAIIKRTLPPPTTRPAGAASKPTCKPAAKNVNGLAASVDWADTGRWMGMQLLLRFTNVSSKPLIVPIGPADKSAIEMHGQAYRGPWRKLYWPFRITAPRPIGKPVAKVAKDPNAPTSPVTLKLKPGQSAVLFLKGDNCKDLIGVSRIKLVLRQKGHAKAKAWRGVVETLPAGRWTTKEELVRRAGSLPMPTFFPEIPREGFTFLNMESWPPRIRELRAGNWHLISALALYDPAEVRAELERRIAAEADPFMRMFLAALAARAGSKKAAMLLLEVAKSTDCETVRNLHEAIKMVLSGHDNNPPEWAAELATGVIRDQRWVIGLPKGPNYFSAAGHARISRKALAVVGLAYRLSQTQYRNAVGTLIEAAKTHRNSIALMALGNLSDKRAIPFLMEVARSDANEDHSAKGRWSSDCRQTAIGSLGALKATEAVGLLTKRLWDDTAIAGLENIGDPNAVPALRKLIAAGKTTGRPIHSPDNDADCIATAKIALVALEGGDRLAKYRALLADKSFGEYDRRSVVWRLGWLRDPGAIPILIDLIKTDPSGAVVNQSITVLSAFKDKRAVEGLIECFDADFEGKEDWKRALIPEMFRENIGETLRTITGQSICPDKRQWQRWLSDQPKAAWDR